MNDARKYINPVVREHRLS